MSFGLKWMAFSLSAVIKQLVTVVLKRHHVSNLGVLAEVQRIIV
jgi:hypothetical protein